MRTDGRSWAEVAEEFRDRYSVNARVAMRLAHGWSQADVAKEWCERWPDSPRTDQNISTWERWPESGHAPSLATLVRLAEIYQCDLAHLVADLGRYGHLDDIHARTDAASLVAARPSGGDQPDGAAEPPSIDRVVEQLALLSSSRPFTLASTGGTPDVAAVRAMSDAFRTADRRLGGGVLYGSVTRYLSTEVAPHLLIPTGQTQDSQLFTAAASLTEAAGWMAHDGGNDHVARLHFTRAFKLASVAGDGAVLANVCASMSHLASHLGEPHEAVRLADKGLQDAAQKPVTAQLVARLQAMRALGLAGQGETRASLRALDRAEHSLDSNGSQDAGWVSHFDEASLAIEAAMCLRRLRDLQQAEQHARRAIALRTGDRVRSRTFAHLTLARVLADADRIDEAASAGAAICRIASTLASTRVIHQLDGLKVALADHGSVAEVAEFLGALAELHQSDRAADQPMTWPT
jgi:tetratricopeptide (TPR) repeat protein